MAEVEATIGLRVLASILILIPTLAGLTLQFLLAITLISGWKKFRDSSFYLITTQLLWCDTCALLLDLYAAFPMTLTGVQYMGDSAALYYVPLAFEGIAFNGIFMLSLLLTINRFLLFIFPKWHNKIFTPRGTKALSAFVWIYVFTLILLTNVFGCRKEFSKDFFYFWYHCENYNPKHFHFKDFLYIHSYVIPCIMAAMYMIIYVKLKLTSKSFIQEQSTIRKEVKYLTQTVLICVLIAVEVAGFITLPFLGVNGYGQFYLNMLLNLIIISNNLMTPIVIFSCVIDHDCFPEEKFVQYENYAILRRPSPVSRVVLTQAT
ncbi:unnamed protein product [Nippostrongylus brasiliensis]|uniref:G_PROTEIN_RECEP_F1_2 domain-containing protein n=1 Tax=Nippostrongylus brasiliensis TaxID=27835 RepID=A0A0N4YMA2_NIPBR|nr:unnamed protein product [Nippostrongylus brasiliensis]